MYQRIEEEIEKYAEAVRRTTEAEIDAASCQTRSDFDRANQREGEEEQALESLMRVIAGALKV